MKAFFLHDEDKFPVALVVTELKMHGILFAVATHNPIDYFDKKIAWNPGGVARSIQFPVPVARE